MLQSQQHWSTNFDSSSLLKGMFSLSSSLLSVGPFLQEALEAARESSILLVVLQQLKGDAHFFKVSGLVFSSLSNETLDVYLSMMPSLGFSWGSLQGLVELDIFEVSLEKAVRLQSLFKEEDLVVVKFASYFCSWLQYWVKEKSLFEYFQPLLIEIICISSTIPSQQSISLATSSTSFLQSLLTSLKSQQHTEVQSPIFTKVCKSQPLALLLFQASLLSLLSALDTRIIVYQQSI